MSGRVTVFREYFLPSSETFIRDHLEGLPTWTPKALCASVVSDGLHVSGVALRAANSPGPGVRAAQALMRRGGISEDALLTQRLAVGIGQQRPDVVHAHFGPDAALVAPAAHLARKPLVVTFHGYDATVADETLNEWPTGRRMVSNWRPFMHQVAGIVAVSEFIRTKLIEKGAEPEKIIVVPCGIEVCTFPFTEPPSDGGILFVGRLVEKKGVLDLLTAASRMQARPRIRIVGDGPLRDELQDFSRQSGVAAEFLGMQPRERVMELMREATIVAIPSKQAANGDCEGLPVVSLEAAAMGRPVVAYAHSGLSDSVVDGRTGRLVAEGDVDALGRALDGLLADPSSQIAFSHAGRAHVADHFQRRDCLKSIEAMYERVRPRRRVSVRHRG